MSTSSQRRLGGITRAIGGGVFALVLVTVITIGALSERNAPPAEADVAPTPSATRSPPAKTEPAQPVQSEEAAEPEQPEAAVITPANNAEFAAILALTDYCAPAIAAFADKYSGQTISFDGNIGALNNHDGYATRYDVLIGVGDYSETAQPGPAFQFRDVNLASDLNIIGDNPGSIGAGTTLGVVAEVGEYESSSCLFLIEPLATSVR
ncbi:DUF4839 domain-containing protein [Microbacterium sp. PRF11]|uniref:DUF4839 domain-containing protein n=1 Tax=Microbacterium sp. PRF11 TaxID=2962593 RepID=UPI002881533D|nr:DUF4839 domain-containing protein [Microbacterium sp. PRF11]MDT0116500.1 DUF4839 domain-containing protein [Microbacterium sp. PRF11]